MSKLTIASEAEVTNELLLSHLRLQKERDVWRAEAMAARTMRGVFNRLTLAGNDRAPIAAYDKARANTDAALKDET